VPVVMLAAKWAALFGGCSMLQPGGPLWRPGDNIRCMKKSTIVVVTNKSNIMSMVLNTTELDECCWRNG
jgi:hypothetical protein